MNQVKTYLIHTIDLLSDRTAVIFTQNPDITHIAAYIEGYITCLDQYFDTSLTKELCRFFAKAYKIDSTAMPYTSYPRVFDTSLDDKDKVWKSLNLLRTFAAGL